MQEGTTPASNRSGFIGHPKFGPPILNIQLGFFGQMWYVPPKFSKGCKILIKGGG